MGSVNPLLGRSVLIVEDEPLIALELHTALHAAGASILAATSIKEAFTLITRAQICAAIVDVNLGGHDCSRLHSPYQALNSVHILHGILERRSAIGMAAGIGRRKTSGREHIGRRYRAAPPVSNLTPIAFGASAATQFTQCFLSSSILAA